MQGKELKLQNSPSEECKQKEKSSHTGKIRKQITRKESISCRNRINKIGYVPFVLAIFLFLKNICNGKFLSIFLSL